MAHHITIAPGGYQFTAENDETLLDAALRQGLMLPYGCRDGACGACRGKVTEGQVDHGKGLALKDEEKAAGYTLLCCATAQTDLALEMKGVSSARDIPVKTLPARVETLERAAPDVIILGLKLPANERLQFLAGQYIDILLKEGKRRSFSLANAPHDDALLQLHIRHVPGGFYTEQVFAGMKVRDILRFNGPHGSFSLREDSEKPIIFLAGGTGFAPIKAMIEHALAEGCRRSMRLYWGARQRQDLYLDALPRRWAAESLPQSAPFSYVPVLSDPAESDTWAGRTGLVHQAVMTDFPDLSGHEVYACGSPAMIAAAREDFTRRCGLPEEAFMADAFTFQNT